MQNKSSSQQKVQIYEYELLEEWGYITKGNKTRGKMLSIIYIIPLYNLARSAAWDQTDEQASIWKGEA